MSETIPRTSMSLLTPARLEEMVGTLENLLVGYGTEGITDMNQTLEEFRERMRQRGRELMMPKPEDIVKAFPAEEILRAFSAEERLRGLSTEEIEACLKKRQKKSKPKKKV